MSEAIQPVLESADDADFELYDQIQEDACVAELRASIACRADVLDLMDLDL